MAVAIVSASSAASTASTASTGVLSRFGCENPINSYRPTARSRRVFLTFDVLQGSRHGPQRRATDVVEQRPTGPPPAVTDRGFVRVQPTPSRNVRPDRIASAAATNWLSRLDGY